MEIRTAKHDWHRQDILAAVRKAKGSLAKLSRENGLSPSTLGNTLIRPWPRGEIIIANAIGIPPQEIWPSRFFDHKGRLIRRRVREKEQAEQAVKTPELLTE